MSQEDEELFLSVWFILIYILGTFLVVQWLRIPAPNAGAQVWSLLRELDPTCHN